MKKFFSLAAISFFVCCLTATAAPKKTVFIPMDYSTCGYHASETEIPYVRNAVRVESGDKDSHGRIQAAIDYVSSMKPDKSGHRGAVLLDAGTYNISKALRISASGVVLRGAGKGQTVIKKTGCDRGALIYIEGKKLFTAGDTLEITEDVKAGATTIKVNGNVSGKRISILRPSTQEWIDMLQMADFGGGLDYTGWKPTDTDITWDRTVVAANGNELTLDAPVTCSIEKKYGGGMVITSYNAGELTECGVENLTLESEYDAENAMDEDHCWDGVWMDCVRDCWVRQVDFLHFAGSAVNMQKYTSRITVEDCVADEPVSEIGGWRRGVFLTRGQQNLVQRCVSRHGIHDFAADFCAAGPNAFVQCEAEKALGFSGSIGSWAPGLLFDIVDIDGNDIKFANLDQFQFGTGWNTANSMLWQCTGSTLYCYSPDAENRNSGHGCWGTLTGNGEWTSSNDHVKPRSLFYEQLSQRMGEKALEGYILPRNVDATSSPTVEQAMAMAQLSLTEPRLTLRMWIDSVAAKKNLLSLADTKGLKTMKWEEKSDEMAKNTFSIVNGHITVNGKLMTGNRFSPPWWSGRVKDNFVNKDDGRLAITRFVPGREGKGWTDRIDSVTSYLKEKGFCMLDHNYGLWYDLRRTDHERVRRADGDVWAPLYEQPFARTGKGKAWDGLTLYDLTKPNKWYWMRLKEFAAKGAQEGLMLFHQNYFQHNILEAGAHWVDCPWRPVNNVNGTNFPEPVPFAGDKRIFIAEQFYDTSNEALVALHKQYIRQCLENFADNDNVVQLISEEYTGPLHFTRFWLETIAEWEAETGRRPMIALSCTKDAQDAILADPILNKVVDIIDIRYWHYNTDGLWAPEAGKNMAPRQFMRKMKVGKTGFDEAYKAVKEYREKYPEKAVTFFAQQYPQYGWAILLAGGSLPNVKIDNEKLLEDVCQMKTVECENGIASGNPEKGYLVYSNSGNANLKVSAGKYNIYTVDMAEGIVKLTMKSAKIDEPYTSGKGLFWLEKK